MHWVRVRISIHTPVKGVTAEEGGVGLGNAISIHTPVKGVTLLPTLNSQTH